MKTLTLEVPAMYGDHHVIEVRRLLSEIPGVEDIYASSAFHLVEVTYDENKADESQIKAKLEEAGYLGEFELPVESNVAEIQKRDETVYRHTESIEQSGKVVTFARKVSFTGRSSWPCPGIGVIKKER
jgi:copper chaperone CopZ